MRREERSVRNNRDIDITQDSLAMRVVWTTAGAASQDI
jgi:hypothetical protein